MKFNKKLKKGFTLVELIVVIAIVAILAAVSVVSYLAFINQANESADIQLVKQLNVALQADETLNDTRDTMKEMLEGMEAQGFVVENLTKTKSGYDIVWDQEHNRFGLLNGEKVIFAEEGFSSAKNINKWKFVDNVDEANTATNLKYSIYLTDEFGKAEVESLNIKAGLDAGNVKIATVNYSNDEAQTVTIRTSSAYTNLNINAENDTVKHYDTVGKVDITKIDMNCYYEYGTAAYVKVVEGKVVAKDGGSIDVAFANNTDGSKVAVIEENGTVETGYTTNKPTSDTNLEREGGVNLLYSEDGVTAYTESDIDNKGEDAIEEAKAPEIAEELEDEATALVYNLTTGLYYDDLYKAIDDVPENTKTTLVLLKNISNTNNENYTISKEKNIVLDLNGNTISTYAPDEEKSYTIVNYGTLTIKDNTDVSKNGSGSGKIVSTVNKADMADVPGYASNTITNSGKLTIESGLIENKGAGYACFAIDNQTNGALYTPELIINGGRMLQESASHYAVRMFCNSTTNVNKVVVNGGIIEGGYAFWMQTPNNNANKAELVINGGEFIAYDGAAVYFGGSGSTTDGRQYSNTSVIINGGTLNKIMMGGVSSVEKAPQIFEINGGRITELALGSNLSPIIRGGVYNSSVISTWGYVYIVDGEVYHENQDGSRGEKYESPFDKKSYWEDNGYSFEYDSNYGDYVVKIAKSINDIIGDYLDSDYQLVDNGDGTSSVVHK